jgi:hypothetical protein
MGIEEIQARDAGPAPAAPASGPLLNVSQTLEMAHPEQEEQLPAASDTPSDAESPPQTLFVTRQQEASAPQAADDVPVFDAGPARVDLMTR